MNCLLITEVFPPAVGGSGRWLWEVYHRLPGGRAVVLTNESAGCSAFDQSQDLIISRLPWSFSGWGITSREARGAYRRVLAEALRLVTSERIEAVHCARCLPEGLIGLALRALRGIPYDCFVHGEEIGVAWSSRELRQLIRIVFKGSRRVIANSRNTRAILRDRWGVPERRVAVVHPGVDTSRYVPAARSSRARILLGWGDRPVLLTVGRFETHKGHDRMIEAVSMIRDRHPDIIYSIIGDGDRRDVLQAQVARAGLSEHVQFLGRCTDDQIIAAYQQCDLFVLPNRADSGNFEGFGIVLLEAQSCGRPVLAGASGGTAETMAIPTTGRVVPCETAGSLAEAVLELLGVPDRLDRMGEAARRWAVERFDWEVVSGECHRALGLSREPTKALVSR